MYAYVNLFVLDFVRFFKKIRISSKDSTITFEL
jgi:hypothetical protein